MVRTSKEDIRFIGITAISRPYLKVMPLPVPKPQSTHRHHRVDALWDHNADKYRVVCRSIHVMKATQYIGYAQLIIIGMFTATLLFFYGRQINGSLPADHWLSSAGGRYLTSLLTAVSLQLSLVLMMLHGVRSQRRSFLLPFIIFAAFAVFLAFIQVSSDVVAASQQRAGAASGVQLLSHVMGMFVHIWCVAVVWRCYCFLGDKKVADRIAEQLQATSMAFAYDYTQPPPYADTVIEKHPLTIA
uniref:Actin cortical patch SUR7/pH-response regulator pali n=1 Tax=Heterorhabditis bacteriophora TaxID=37862 RepID=A0A1I7XML6_HETBA